MSLLFLCLRHLFGGLGTFAGRLAHSPTKLKSAKSFVQNCWCLIWGGLASPSIYTILNRGEAANPCLAPRAALTTMKCRIVKPYWEIIAGIVMFWIKVREILCTFWTLGSAHRQGHAQTCWGMGFQKFM